MQTRRADRRARPLPRCLLAVGLGLAAVGVGCGPPTATIEGEVLLDGRPIEEGMIYFVPLDPGQKAAWTVVRGGRYRVASRPAQPGRYRVEISSPRPTGRTLPPVPPETEARPEVAEAVPAAYNKRSQLTADVAPGGNTLDFKLQK